MLEVKRTELILRLPAQLRQSRFKWKAPRYPPSSLDFWGLERIPYANPTGFFNETSGKIC